MALCDLGRHRHRRRAQRVTVNVRLRELMLPVLLYPLMIPLLIVAMEMTTGLLNGNAVLGDIRYLHRVRCHVHGAGFVSDRVYSGDIGR